MVDSQVVYSLNETEALVRKSAWGAGWAWGLAEEWGYAAKWLAARHLPLTLSAALAAPTLSPTAVTNPLAAAGLLCPIKTGLYVLDHRQHFSRGATMQNVSYPLLILPFAALLGAVRVQWSGVDIIIAADQYWLTENATITADVAERVILSRVDTVPTGGNNANDSGCPQNAEEWRRLEKLAAKTFVAATADSRSHGAGAGLRDDN